MNSRTIRRRSAHRIRCIDHLGGCCSHCGEDLIPLLDIHHLYNKEFDPLTRFGYKWEKVEPELNKCICLCVTCHRLVHAGLLRLRSKDGHPLPSEPVSVPRAMAGAVRARVAGAFRAECRKA